jgi:WD40-like Beta Propeller Repeat
MNSSSLRSPAVKFLALVIACSVGLFSYVYWAKTRTSGSMQSGAGGVEPLLGEAPRKPAPVAEVGIGATRVPEQTSASKSMARDPRSGQEPVQASDPAAPATSPEKASARKHIFFRHTATGGGFGKLAVADDADLSSRRFVGDLSCEVFHIAAGVGLCLTADQGVFTKFGADVLDSTFKRRFHFDLRGIPSRCRVSPDGRFAAWTVFLTGHSYASSDFTTQTMLIDTTTGEVLGDLEGFSVNLDGQSYKSADFNFWGVTFAADSNIFYCTLSSNRKHYLVKGDIKSRKLSVVREDVECPSLSPDGTRIAYKKRNTVSGRPAWIPAPQVIWQLHVLELATMIDTPLVEIRSVDDQLAWLDDSHVLYALPSGQTNSSATTDVWMAPIDGTASPTLFLPAAYSPSVVP